MNLINSIEEGAIAQTMTQCIYDLWDIFPDEVRTYVNEVQKSENIDTWKACLKGVGLLAQTANTANEYFMRG